MLQDFDSCPSKCTLACEDECELHGLSTSTAAERCRVGCYYDCAVRGECATCYDGCDVECIHQCGVDIEPSASGASAAGDGRGEGTCSEADGAGSTGGECYHSCYETCASRERCADKAYAASSHWCALVYFPASI